MQPGNSKPSVPTSAEPPILVNYQGNTSTVTLNRPKALNAMDIFMVRSMKTELDKWNQDPSIKVVIFKGSGRAFSAGGDLLSFYKAIQSPTGLQFMKTGFVERYGLDYAIATLRPFQVAFWDGIVFGGGVGVSIHAPIRIATENALFAMPEAKAGLFNDVGAGYFLPKIRNHIGYFLGLTGTILKGKELVQVGVADFFVKKENLTKLEQEIAQSTTATTSVEDLKVIVKKYEEPVERKYANEELIEELFSKDSLEKIFDAVKNSEKNKQFTQKILNTWSTLSPFSLRVIFERLKRGKELKGGKDIDLRDELMIDVKMMVRFLQLPDALEGLRCTVVDKGATPKWSYKSIYEVPQEEVDKLFAPFETDKLFLQHSKL